MYGLVSVFLLESSRKDGCGDYLVFVFVEIIANVVKKPYTKFSTLGDRAVEVWEVPSWHVSVSEYLFASVLDGEAGPDYV